jgi:hypothetical protein
MLLRSSTPVALDEKEHKSNRAKFGQLAHRTMIELPVSPPERLLACDYQLPKKMIYALKKHPNLGTG